MQCFFVPDTHFWENVVHFLFFLNSLLDKREYFKREFRFILTESAFASIIKLANVHIMLTKKKISEVNDNGIL